MKKHLLILFFLSLFLFTLFIGSVPILDGDTAFSAKIAKNIIEKGDWITLRFTNPIDIVPKPPLFYWIMAAGMKIFGINEFGLSIFHSLIGVLTVLLTYLIAKELYNEKIAFWSGLILLTSAQFFYAGRSPLQDMPLTFFIAAAFYCFILFEKQKKHLFLYLIPVFTAMALLIKGPVGLVLVGLVLLIYTIWNKSFFSYLRLWPHLCLCLCLCLALLAPWFIAEYKILGKPFADIMISSNFGRFFHPTDSIGNDPAVNTAAPQYDFYSYFLQLFILFVPWSGFLYPAIFSEIKKPENRFVISWALGVLLFFSLSLNYKISRYILPAYPALAIIVARFLVELSEPANKFAVNGTETLVSGSLNFSKWLNVLLIIPLLVVGTVYMILSFPKQQAAYQPIILPFLSIFTAGMIASSVFLFKKQLAQALKLSVFFCVASYLIFIVCLNLYFKSANPIKKFCEAINKNNDGIAALYRAESSSPFAAFYLKDDFVETRDEEKIKTLTQIIPKVYVISEDPEADKIIRKPKVVLRDSNFILFSN